MNFTYLHCSIPSLYYLKGPSHRFETYLKLLCLCHVTYCNRVFIPQRCQYSVNEGHLDDWHLVHLGHFATGDAGIVFTEATAVQKSGRITHGCPGLWADSQIAGHARVVQFARRHGAIPVIQLAHAGGKSGMQRPWYSNSPRDQEDFVRGDMPGPVVGPSVLPVKVGSSLPIALSEADIDALIADFAVAAERRLSAGYQIAEVHGAHGYSLHIFLSPLSNHRADGYGGSLTRRMWLSLEVVAVVRAVWPDHLPLFSLLGG
jgi:2,4-dienoyl-CoA reductase-like NADH-dependent reductase (Old Yellow Enzyme family)